MAQHPDTKAYTETAAYAYEYGTPSLFLKTSNLDMAHRIGLWLRETGRSMPHGVRPSRGYSWHVNDMIVSYANSSERPERIK